MRNVRLIFASAAIAVSMVLSVFAGGQAVAQQAPQQPAAVISITSLEETLGDIDYLVDASGFGQMKFIIQTQMMQYLKGIDQTRPSGVLLYMDDGADQPSALGFVPVTELDDLLDVLAGFAEVDEGDEYTTIITDDEKEIFLKQVNDHAFISDGVEMFERIPADPASLLMKLPQRFNLAARIYGQRIPQAMRDKAIQTIREAYEQQLEMLDEEDDSRAQLAQQQFDMNMEQIESLVQQTDEAMVGMVIDQENKLLSIEFEIVGLEGSKLAKSASKNADPKPSRFSSFMLPGAIFNFSSRTELTEEDIAQYDVMTKLGQQNLIDSLAERTELTDEQLDVIEDAIAGLFKAGNATIANGVIDAGGVLKASKGKVNFATGALLKDASQVEQIAKKAIESGQFPVENVKFNSGSHNGVTFHTIMVAVPDDMTEVKDAFGDRVEIILGVGEDVAYIAVGSDPLTLLKEGIDGSGPDQTDAPAALGTYNVFLSPIMNLAAEMVPDQPMLEPLAEKLSATGRDRLQYTLRPIKNGYSVRGNLQDGFMEMIQAATEAMGQGGNGQF